MSFGRNFWLIESMDMCSHNFFKSFMALFIKLRSVIYFKLSFCIKWGWGQSLSQPSFFPFVFPHLNIYLIQLHLQKGSIFNSVDYFGLLSENSNNSIRMELYLDYFFIMISLFIDSYANIVLRLNLLYIKS